MQRFSGMWLMLGVGLALGFSVAWAEGELVGKVAPMVLDVRQAVPVMIEAPVMVDGEMVTVTAPLTVMVGLQVEVTGATVKALPAAPATVVVTNSVAGDLTDDLGTPYTIEDIDPDIALEGWTAYIRPNGWWAVAGDILNEHKNQRFSIIDFRLRFYKDGELVGVENFAASGRWVDPGERMPFETTTTMQPGDFDTYTMTISGGDWTDVP